MTKGNNNYYNFSHDKISECDAIAIENEKHSFGFGLQYCKQTRLRCSALFCHCFFFVLSMICPGTIADRDGLVEFAKLGAYCEWDLFGVETSHYSLDSGFDMPSDAQRIRSIKWLIDEGFEDRIVIGHDIHTKHRLV
jgi:Phosphotriesterase family